MSKMRKTGIVVGNKRYLEGTLVVNVKHIHQNSIYKKNIIKNKRYIVQYDILDKDGKRKFIPENSVVEILESKPISKKKCFIVTQILKDGGVNHA